MDSYKTILLALGFLIIFIFSAKKAIKVLKEWMRSRIERRSKREEYEAAYQKELLKAKRTERRRTHDLMKDFVKYRFKDYIAREKEIEADYDEKFSDMEKIGYFLSKGDGWNKILDMYSEEQDLLYFSKAYEAEGGEYLNKLDEERWEQERLLLRNDLTEDLERKTGKRIKPKLRRVK